MFKQFILSLMIVSAAAPIAPQNGPTGVIQGIVARSGTLEPLAGAQISVVATSAPGPAVTRPSIGIAVSDASGQFTIRDVPVGNMTVRAQLSGYFATPVNEVSAVAASVPVSVAAGQASNVRLVMVPGATISGRVTDPGGRPIRDISVQAIRVVDSERGTVLQPAASRNTDDRGDYRLFDLMPGEYLVAVVPQQRRSSGSGEVPVRTFYPGATDFDAAAPIAVDGDERNGIDIRVRTAIPVTVSGAVASTLPPGPVVRSTTTSVGVAGTVRPSIAEWAFVLRDSSRDTVFVSGTASSDKNTFEIPGVLPGSYELIARLPAAAGWGPLNPPRLSLASFAYGRTTLEVRDTNVENVRVVVHQGVDLHGVVKVDGRTAAAALRLSLKADGARSMPLLDVLEQIAIFTPPIEQDGSFLFPLLPEARYRFDVVLGAPPLQLNQAIRVNQEEPSGARTPQAGLLSLPETAYVADIRQSGTSVYDNGLYIDAGLPAPVEVLVNTDGGRLEGTVLDSEQKPAANVVVVLVPIPARRQNPALYKNMRSDAQGRFAFTPVPPGSFKLFAWQAVQANAYLNSAFISRFEAQGTSVTITPSGRVIANVSLIPTSR